jgi:solute carrier family 35 protein F3/4
MIVIQNQNDDTSNEIAAIFNPKRVRAPSVVVTNDSPNNNGPSLLGNANQIIHSDSITSSQPDGAESLTGVIIDHQTIDHSHVHFNSLTQIHSNQLPRSASTEHEQKPKGCKGCCSELAQKVR